MQTTFLEPQAHSVPAQVSYHSSALIEMIRVRHPDVRFRGPTYWPDKHLWVIDAFFDDGEDFDLQEQLSERETDILLAAGIWLCVVPMPLALYGSL